MQQPDEGSRLLAKPGNHLFRQTLAAMTVERESAGERRAQLLVERVAQQVARAVQPRLHRLVTKAKQVCGLLNRHAFHDAGDEHRTECIRYLIDWVFDTPTTF